MLPGLSITDFHTWDNLLSFHFQKKMQNNVNFSVTYVK